MRRLLLISLGLIVAGGCASTPPSRPAYSNTSASALAFDPPVAYGQPHPELARAPREPSAFLGFDEQTAEYYTTATDNAQSNVFGDYYSQESISVRTGVRYR